MATCPLCRHRKAKRPCPAKGELICSHCCGTKRLVEIDCPPDCKYLTGEHAPSWGGREAERRRDSRRVAPYVQDLTETQSRLFFLSLMGMRSIREQRRDLDDAVLEEAVSAVRKTVETRSRGVLFEHAPETLRAQEVFRDVRQLFEKELSESDEEQVDLRDGDRLAVLTALEAALAGARREAGEATAFLDTAERLSARFGRPRPRPLIIEP
jgi:hypothetical protein